VAGRGDNARVDFQFPQVLEFGAAYRLTDHFTVVTQARWTEFSAFEDTELRFARRTFLNRTAVNDARDRFRLGGGVQYLLFPGVTLQVGFSWERWAIKSSSLAPTLPDLTEYYMFPVGISLDRGSWQIDLSAGQSYTESRHVTAERNPFFAGRYALDQAIFCTQITYRLGKSE
jgi:long-subunit fatty acid transport protein